MNSKTFFPFIAVVTLFLIGFASALGSIQYTSFNDVPLNVFSAQDAGSVGEVVPVRVVFVADTDASDVKVKVYMDGFRDDISASTGRFNVVKEVTYSKLLSLRLPSEIKDTTKDVRLYVSISSADDKNEFWYEIHLQRESYSLNAISVDFDSQVSAGQTVPISVVVENNGMEDLENGFVTATISELGVSAKSYFGDLSPVDNCTNNCDNEDAVQKILYLRIPDTAQAGTYNLVVRAYNSDATLTSTKQITVSGSSSTLVLPAVKNQDIGAGQTKTYDLVVVNSGNSIKVYNIQTVSGSALSVSAPAVVTVGPQSSTTVPISVTASRTADLGAYTFSVIVDGQQTVLGANVTSATGITTSVVALTVVLVIIFVVLLVVLIILLTRKGNKPTEEVETSYY